MFPRLMFATKYPTTVALFGGALLGAMYSAVALSFEGFHLAFSNFEVPVFVYVGVACTLVVGPFLRPPDSRVHQLLFAVTSSFVLSNGVGFLVAWWFAQAATLLLLLAIAAIGGAGPLFVRFVPILVSEFRGR